MAETGKKPNSRDIMGYFIETFQFFSDFFKKLGEIEKKYGISFEVFQKDKSKELLDLISPDIPPEQLGHFFKFILLIARIGKDFQNFYSMSADQKIEAGNKIKKIVEEYKKTLSD
ncbi:MAG: hypothetical protein ACFE9L_08970 [Candidatus Hodarchaeota archaeon]